MGETGTSPKAQSKVRPLTSKASAASMGTAKTTSKVFDKGPLSAASSFFHEVDEDHVAETSWPKIAYIIVANFLGAGVLSIPFAASQLGYVLFVAFLTAVYLASLLSGKAFYAAFTALPKSRALSDIGKACYGAAGETTVRFFQYLYMSLVLIILHLTCAISLGRIIPGLCVVIYSIIVAGVMITLLQVRDMSEVGTLSLVGTATILIVVLIALIGLPIKDSGSGGGESLFPGQHSTVILLGVSMVDVVFSFAGQIIYVELQSEMEEPKDFMKSMYTANTIMYVCYLLVGCVGYHFVGAGDLKGGDPVTSEIFSKGSGGDRFVNALLFVHVLIAYLIEANVVSRGFFLIGGKDALKVSRAAWTAMTCFLVGVAFLISNLVPFFGTITGFASAISGTIICWTLPYIFALKVGDLTSFEAASMKALVPVTIIIAVVGVVATVMDMINKIGDQKGAPFGCSSN